MTAEQETKVHKDARTTMQAALAPLDVADRVSLLRELLTLHEQAARTAYQRLAAVVSEKRPRGAGRPSGVYRQGSQASRTIELLAAGPTRVVDLQAALGFTNPGTHSVVHRLKKAGVVRRRDDGRRELVTPHALTPPLPWHASPTGKETSVPR